ncbi:MAG TPA: DUF6600 domain-containing protein, partial [Thermoanaerobaculia bacterium]|nr:DUF6600 domain-containing protein [Thermoanaerobaculia bacterium]
MKIARNVLFALLLLGVCAGAASAQPSVGAGVQVGPRGHASVDLGFFYDSLASYGNWIERPSYGWVWTPRDVSASWRPYQAGHWVWSDEGWTWLSDEPYGWATYHYGRWYQDPEIGWAWVPGNDWAPAWVSWQEGNDYVGWAPLPPGANVNASNTGGPGPGYDNGPNGPGYDDQAPAYDNGQGYDNRQAYDNGPAYDDNGRYESGPVYDNGYGYDGGYGYGNYAYGIAPAAYLFVPTRAFLSVDLFDFFVPWVRVSSFFGSTRNCTSYGFYGGRYFNRGIAFEHVRRYYHNVPRYRLAGLDGFRGRGYQVEGNRLSFFRPQVSRGWRGSPLDRAGARRSVTTAGQFRNEHPDRQRAFAQTNGQGFGRNNQRDNRQGFSSRQAQGDRSGQRWQQDQATRQRSFENGRGQVDRQQFNAQRQQQNNNAQRQQQFNQRQQTQQWQQNNAQRQQWQQDQANRQRQYNSQRAQPQAGWQRQSV